MREGILETIQSFVLSPAEKEKVLLVLQGLLEAHGEILFAYAHGSFLEDRPFRDLDLAVFVREEDIGIPLYACEDALAREVLDKIHFPFPVDVRLLNRTPLAFQYHVFAGRLLLDREPETRVHQIAYVVGRYLDIQPVLRHHVKEAFSNGSQP